MYGCESGLSEREIKGGNLGLDTDRDGLPDDQERALDVDPNALRAVDESPQTAVSEICNSSP